MLLPASWSSHFQWSQTLLLPDLNAAFSAKETVGGQGSLEWMCRVDESTERMLLSGWTQAGQGPKPSQSHWKRAKLSLYASGSECQSLSLVQLPVLMNDWATCAQSRNYSFFPHNGYSLRLLCRLTPPPAQSVINMLRFLGGFAVVGATSSGNTLSTWPQLFLGPMSSAAGLQCPYAFFSPSQSPVRFPDSSCVEHSKTQLLICVHVIPLGQRLGTKPARPTTSDSETPRVGVWKKFQIQSSQWDFVVAL